MKAIHLLIATLIMMSLHPAQQKVVTAQFENLGELVKNTIFVA